MLTNEIRMRNYQSDYRGIIAQNLLERIDYILGADQEVDWDAIAPIVEEYKEFKELNDVMQKEETRNLDSSIIEEDSSKFQVIEEDFEQDIVLLMPPKEEKIIKARVHYAGKIKPRIVIDEIDFED